MKVQAKTETVVSTKRAYVIELTEEEVNDLSNVLVFGGGYQIAQLLEAELEKARLQEKRRTHAFNYGATRTDLNEAERNTLGKMGW